METGISAIPTSAPARAFGLYPRKGVIQPGADADLVHLQVLGGEREAALPRDGGDNISLVLLAAPAIGTLPEPPAA